MATPFRVDPPDYYAAPPSGYRCHDCGSGNVKLWRTVMDNIPHPTCAPCSLREQEHDGTVDANGEVEGRDGQKTSCIHWRVPAILRPDGRLYSPGDAIPVVALQWWQRLPTNPPRRRRQGTD